MVHDFALATEGEWVQAGGSVSVCVLCPRICANIKGNEGATRVQRRSAPVLDIFFRRYFDKLDRNLRAGLLVTGEDDVAKAARVNELDLLVLGTDEGIRVWFLCWHGDLTMKATDALAQRNKRIWGQLAVALETRDSADQDTCMYMYVCRSVDL